MASQIWFRDREFAGHHQAVVRSDTVNLPQDMVIYCNAAGDVSAVDHYDRAMTYTVVAGQILPVIVKRVNLTGTTLTDAQLIGLW
jgi:hypothetical protein